MNRRIFVFFCSLAMLVMTAGIGSAGVDISINIGPPPVYTFAAPPEMVIIPNTYAYFVPGIDFDIVFYHGYWWRPHNGYWYRATGYNGPWHYIVKERVPRYIIKLPPDYRRHYHDHPRIPYGHVHKNWNRWEREKYWDKRQWKHDKEEWKQDRKERKQDAKEMRHERREDRREDRREMRDDRRDKRQDVRKDRQENRKEMRDDRRDDRQQSKAQKPKDKDKDKDKDKGKGKQKDEMR